MNVLFVCPLLIPCSCCPCFSSSLHILLYMLFCWALQYSLSSHTPALQLFFSVMIEPLFFLYILFFFLVLLMFWTDVQYCWMIVSHIITTFSLLWIEFNVVSRKDLCPYLRSHQEMITICVQPSHQTSHVNSVTSIRCYHII